MKLPTAARALCVVTIDDELLFDAAIITPNHLHFLHLFHGLPATSDAPVSLLPKKTGVGNKSRTTHENSREKMPVTGAHNRVAMGTHYIFLH